MIRGGFMKWDDYRAEVCYECTGYGDDYSVDEDGELVCNCDTCSYNSYDDWDYDDDLDDWI